MSEKFKAKPGTQGDINWQNLSVEEQAKLVKLAAVRIAQDTGYKSRKEKAEKRKLNGTLANIDPRARKQKGNRPNPKTKARRGAGGKHS